MIKFPCQCGFEFEVPQEMAGNPLQCPRCMRLVDVPRLSDLEGLDRDGTILMEPIPLEEEGRREAELKRAYMPRRHDEAGEEYDLRASFEQVVAAGADDIPLEMKDEVRPGTPKYDPVSGELIKVLTVRGDEAQTVIPLPAGPPTLHYQKHYESPKQAMWKAPILMFTPGSAAVLIFIYAAHLVSLAAWVPVGGGLVFAGFVILFVYMLMLAHLTNIVEEVGPGERDELPTPLRGVAWYEDVWLPYFRFTVAFALCYFPALMVFFSPEMWHKAGPLATLAISFSLLGIGTFLFPVVLLTAATSGTYVNFRPDRLLGTIGAIGARYIPLVILWAAAAGIYMVAMVSSVMWFGSLMGFLMRVRSPIPVGLSLGILALGIYLLHIFCWLLGLCYRHYHANFPWAMQKHVSTRKIQRRIVRRSGAPIPVAAKDGPGVPVEAPPRLRAKPVRE